MSRPRSRVIDYVVYLVTRFVLCIFQVLSSRGGRSLAAGLAWLTYRVDKRHREIARDNLRKAFPGRYTDVELDQLVRATYRHFCTLLAELALIPRKVRRDNCGFYYEPGEIVRNLLRSDRPVLMVTAHLGSWEMAGLGLNLHGFKTFAVARPLDNPYLEAYLLRFRQHTGQTVLAKNGQLDRIKEVLANKGKVAIVADQHAGPRGQMATFFGRPASTHKSVAILSLQYRALIIVVGNVKVGEPMRYRSIVSDVIDPDEYTCRRSRAVEAITQRFTTGLEQVIRTAPDQYLWLHNRWKAYAAPKGRVAEAA